MVGGAEATFGCRREKFANGDLLAWHPDVLVAAGVQGHPAVIHRHQLADHIGVAVGVTCGQSPSHHGAGSHRPPPPSCCSFRLPLRGPGHLDPPLRTVVTCFGER